tara:strand:- start:587 stop:2734 length:2148 start_codon:yes stop_codon:yes gene_type:complete
MSGYLKLFLIEFLCQFFMAGNPVFASELVHHQLKIEFDPDSLRIGVQDRISLKTLESDCGIYSFYLHGGMQLDRKEISSVWTLSNEKLVAGKPNLQKIVAKKNKGRICPNELVFFLSYSGVLADPSQPRENSNEGVIYSGSDYFYPILESKNSMVTFDMKISLPKFWEPVSQGKREKLNALKGISNVRWNSAFPAEEIFLIVNRYKVFEEQYKEISLYAFLLKEEENLANKYIETAKYYIDLYSKILGPYPYSKFALVENSQQTGYGMPSFTLMGSRIIRFPFILHSSYPHEILHNWWGNGVFPDPKDGNWSEGLTAYLADHFLLELKGKGSQYRFQEMMKYLSYVNDSNEFPIKEFTFRDSMATQAIGYGKLLMVFHMLRMELGENQFLKGLRKYYENYKYRHAGFKDIKKIFETVSGKNLDWFFEQWIQRKGAPRIELVDASYIATKGRYDLSIKIKKITPTYRFKLPVAIWKEGSEEPDIQNLLMDGENHNFLLNLSGKPKALRLDPYNEVFRILDKKEIPASIGQTFGSAEAIIVLPRFEEGEIFQGYRQFANSLIEKGNVKKTILNDSKTNLPSSLSLWVFGKNNEMQKILVSHLNKLGIVLEAEGFRLNEGFFSFKEHSFVFTIPRFENGKGTLTWLIASSKDVTPGLIRKLPHYGKYGYLVFKGDAPENVVKGIWPSTPINLQKIFKKGNFSLPTQSPLVSFQSFGDN